MSSVCVFGVLVCWWSACELTSRSPTDKNTKHTDDIHILRNNTNSTNTNQQEE